MSHLSATTLTDDPRAGRALLRVTSLIGQTNDPGEALRAILAVAMDTFGAVSGSISLPNPDTGLLEIEVQQGLTQPTDKVPLRPGQGITGWVAFHGRPLLVADVAAEPRYIRVREDVRCEMAVPLTDPAGNVLGVLNLDATNPGEFNPEDLKLLIQLADAAASIMQCLWQLRHLGGKARQLEGLITVGQSLVTQLAPQELLNTITHHACRMLGVRACACYLYDSARQTVRLAALSENESASPDPDALPSNLASEAARLHRLELPLDACVVSAVIRTRRAVEFGNIQSPEFDDVSDLPRDPRLRSFLAKPIFDGPEVTGVLAVFTNRVHRFSNDEKRLLRALASLGAVALQNSRLYARVFQSEAELRKNEQLTTLGLLAAEIAHEIRNPLTVIKLLFGYLPLDFPEGDPRRTDVRVISEKIDQLEAIVTRVLHFAKAPASLHSRWPVAEIIDDTAVLIRLKLAQAKVQLTIAPPPRTLLVDANKGQIQQVLLNLILNSMQVMPEGGAITLTTAVTEHDGEPCVTVDVTDTGTGIPEALRDRIFDSFLSGRPDGTGLGLAIAKRIVASHHGDLSLLSTSPAGTTMRIRLPLAKG